MNITKEQREQLMNRWYGGGVVAGRPLADPLDDLFDDLVNGATAPEPLVSITVKDIDAVPQVIYKGEPVENKTAVIYTWTTKTRDNAGGQVVSIYSLEGGEEDLPAQAIIHHVK